MFINLVIKELEIFYITFKFQHCDICFSFVSISNRLRHRILYKMKSENLHFYKTNSTAIWWYLLHLYFH